MKESIPARRSHIGIISSSKQYFVFAGPKAAIRTKSASPVFQFDADAAFSQASPAYLFRFDMRSNERVIRVAKAFGGGLAPFSIPKDHMIPTTLEEIGDG